MLACKRFRGLRIGLLRDTAMLMDHLMVRKNPVNQAGLSRLQILICGNKTWIHSHNGATSESGIIAGTIPRRGKAIQVGQFAELRRSFSQEDVYTFGRLVGDMNPVHFPDNETQKIGEVADATKPYNQSHRKPIVHGMLLSSLFSSIFGSLIPGAIYRSQSLKFNNPICVGEEVIGRVIVRKLKHTNRNGSGVLCMCDTMVVKSIGGVVEKGDEIVAISGEAQVWLPDATIKAENENQNIAFPKAIIY